MSVAGAWATARPEARANAAATTGSWILVMGTPGEAPWYPILDFARWALCHLRGSLDVAGLLR